MGEKMQQAVKDLKSKRFWLQCFGEFFGTLLLIYGIEATSNYNANVRITSTTSTTVNNAPVLIDPVHRGIIIGCIVMALHRFFGPASGGYLNPAVTMGAYFSGDVCTLRGSMYAGFQYIGGILGAGLHFILTPESQHAFGTELHPTISVARGFFIEFMMSFILTLVYLARDSKSGKKKYFESAVAIGLTYIALNAIGQVYTGASINPARALGVPIVTGIWPKDGYIYYIAPYVGSCFGGGLYRLYYERYIFAEEIKPSSIDVEAQ